MLFTSACDESPLNSRQNRARSYYQSLKSLTPYFIAASKFQKVDRELIFALIAIQSTSSFQWATPISLADLSPERRETAMDQQNFILTRGTRVGFHAVVPRVFGLPRRVVR